ncbi:MAG: hypothetical protein U0168_31970 [Nannocystaceae bacterium]
MASATARAARPGERGADPAPIHYQAVQETSGQYLNYNGTLTYGFFVAGDSGVAGPGCMGVDANAATEHRVTYNGGRSGTDVEQMQLGYVHDPADAGYGQNRGCMGQWSARCLENDNGQDVTQILQFFYGDDIGITQAPGECVVPLPGDTTTGGGESSGGVADTTGASGPGGGSGGSVSAGEVATAVWPSPAAARRRPASPIPASETSLGDDGTGGGDPGCVAGHLRRELGRAAVVVRLLGRAAPAAARCDRFWWCSRACCVGAGARSRRGDSPSPRHGRRRSPTQAWKPTRLRVSRDGGLRNHFAAPTPVQSQAGRRSPRGTRAVGRAHRQRQDPGGVPVVHRSAGARACARRRRTRAVRVAAQGPGL